MQLHHSRLCSVLAVTSVVTFGACGGDSTTQVDPVEVTTTSLPPGAPGLEYNETLAANGGGSSSYTWSLPASSGALPDGLELGADGTISGFPATVENAFFTVEAATGSDSDQQALSIDIAVDCYIADCTGLVGMWRLDEAPLADSSTVHDGSEGGHHGLVITADGTDDKSSSGQIDGAIHLDGVDDYVEIEDSPDFDLQDSFTLMAWINADSLNFGYQAIISKSASPVRPASLWLYYDAVEVWFTPGGFQAASTATITAGAWHHVAVTFDNAADEIRIYIDGVLTDTETGVTATPDTNDLPLVIGQRGDDLYWTVGQLDGVMVWNRVLSALEIDEIFDYGP